MRQSKFSNIFISLLHPECVCPFDDTRRVQCPQCGFSIFFFKDGDAILTPCFQCGFEFDSAEANEKLKAETYFLKYFEVVDLDHVCDNSIQEREKIYHQSTFKMIIQKSLLCYLSCCNSFSNSLDVFKTCTFFY